MARFRKKPVEIEAFQFTIPMGDNPPGWLLNALRDQTIVFRAVGSGSYLTIGTLEGDMRADQGDWIIRGVKGELYPCKPDIFEATYEAV